MNLLILSIAVLAPFVIRNPDSNMDINILDEKDSSEIGDMFTGELGRAGNSIGFDGIYEMNPDSSYAYVRLSGSQFTGLAKDPLILFTLIDYAYLDKNLSENEILVLEFDPTGTALWQEVTSTNIYDGFWLVKDSRILTSIDLKEKFDDGKLIIPLSDYGVDKQKYILKAFNHLLVDKSQIPSNTHD